jgi:hypothetical protein
MLTQKPIKRFNLYLPKKDYDTLVRLQQLSGKSSLAETICSALKVYQYAQGKDIVMRDPKTGEEEKLLLI